MSGRGAKISAALRARHADPAAFEDWCAKRGHLTAAQRTAILAEIRNPARRYIDIALDWLVTEETISRIARKQGIWRRRRGDRPARQEA